VLNFSDQISPDRGLTRRYGLSILEKENRWISRVVCITGFRVVRDVGRFREFPFSSFQLHGREVEAMSAHMLTCIQIAWRRLAQDCQETFLFLGRGTASHPAKKRRSYPFQVDGVRTRARA
jgi:hypothetical protein